MIDRGEMSLDTSIADVILTAIIERYNQTK
jgi:hypothetical protein